MLYEPTDMGVAQEVLAALPVLRRLPEIERRRCSIEFVKESMRYPQRGSVPQYG